MQLTDIQLDALEYALEALPDSPMGRIASDALCKIITAHNAGAQEPVAVLHDDGHWTWKGTPPYESNFAGWRMDVYAQPQPMPQTDATRDVKRYARCRERLRWQIYPDRVAAEDEVDAYIDAEIERLERAKGDNDE